VLSKQHPTKENLLKLSEIISWLKKTIQENLFPHPRECFDDPLTEKQPESLPHEVLYIKRKQQKQHFRKALLLPSNDHNEIEF
jgi:hypothetical protein